MSENDAESVSDSTHTDCYETNDANNEVLSSPQQGLLRLLKNFKSQFLRELIRYQLLFSTVDSTI